MTFVERKSVIIVGGYRDWETDDGCMGEFYLDIDVCKKHGGLVHSYFSGDMSRYITYTRERYVSEYEIDNEIGRAHV